MIVVTDVTLTLYYRVHGHDITKLKLTSDDNNHLNIESMDTIVQYD